MRNYLRYASMIVISGISLYLAYTLVQSNSEMELRLWLLISFLSILANQFLVHLFAKTLSPRIPFMVISFALVVFSTVSCIVGSLYYLYIAPISFNDYRLVASIFILQISCIHSTLSSAEFIIKQRQADDTDSLI